MAIYCSWRQNAVTGFDCLEQIMNRITFENPSCKNIWINYITPIRSFYTKLDNIVSIELNNITDPGLRLTGWWQWTFITGLVTTGDLSCSYMTFLWLIQFISRGFYFNGFSPLPWLIHFLYSKVQTLAYVLDNY